jgi:endonuclease III
MKDTVTDADRERAAELLDRLGETYAEEAGISLADKPAPLYQLLVLATLLSARISGSVAVSAARELFAAGMRTPAAMADAGWQDRVDALGRGHYRRYDERTATQLGDGAQLLQERWAGDLRRLHDEARGDLAEVHRRLQDFPGIGPAGAAIFLREAQAVWPDVRPYLDDRVLDGARRSHLPASADELAGLVPEADLPRLAAALVRASVSGAR